MCLSTMAAAGLGNTISDVLGLGLAHYVERGCELAGLRPPKLTPAQMQMSSSRRFASIVSTFGRNIKNKTYFTYEYPCFEMFIFYVYIILNKKNSLNLYFDRVVPLEL